MKKLIPLLLLLFITHANAGTATINTDSATDTRLQNWCFSVGLGLGVWTSATAPASKTAVSATQVKSCMILTVTNSVFAVENTQAQQAITATPISQMN